MNGRYILALSSLVPFLVFAQQPTTRGDSPTQAEQTEQHFSDALKEQRKLLAKNTIVADGSTNPGLVPFGVVAEMAFIRFGNDVKEADSLRRDLRSKFGGSDIDVEHLLQIAAGAHKFAEDVRYEEILSLDAICGRVVRAEPWNSIGAAQVAEEFRAVEKRREDRIEEHYRAAFDGLSAPTRSALLSYLDANVRSRVHWTRLDIVALATETPDSWLYTQRVSCERQLAIPLADRVWRVAPSIPIAVK